MSAPRTRQALDTAAREAARAASRHDVAPAKALRDALANHAASGTVPDREWISTAIRDAATWATHDADVQLLAALGALARAAGR